MKKLYSRYRKLTFAQGAAAAVTLTSVFAIAAPVTGLINFTPNTTISSAQVNNNFNILKNAIESTSSQTFKGSWDVAGATPDLNSLMGSANIGDYYVASTAGNLNAIPYTVGDWAMWNGTTWDRVPSSSAVTTVFGRTGTVTASEGDYSLDKLQDVNTMSPTPAAGNYLRFDGVTWRSAQLPSCAVGEVLKSDGSNFNCVTDNAGAAAFSGAAGRAVITDGSGVLITSTTSAAELGFLSGVSSSIQTQLIGKETSITMGTASQYFRGDKTMQTLNTSVVPETTNLYFTNNRVLTSTLTGFTTLNSPITAADSVLDAFKKTQGQLDSKINTAGGSITTGTLSFSGAASLTVNAPITGAEVANKNYVDSILANLGNGSASTPVIKNTSQPTGLFFPNSTSLGFSIGGAEAMRIGSNKKVMIGPGGNDPLNQLEVATNTGNTVMSIQASSSSPTDTPFLIFQRSRGSFSSKASVQPSDIVGSLQFSGWNGSDFYPVASIYAIAATGFSGSYNPGSLSFRTTPPNSQTPVERMRIDPNGMVGIGVNAAPSAKLEVGSLSDPNNMIRVNSNTTGLSELIANADGQASIHLTSNFSGSAVEGLPSGTTGIIVGNPVPFVLVQASTERLRVTTSGNVGIGNASPSYKLDVNGDINSSGSVRAVGVALSSDKRLKKNITPITHALERLLGLRGVEFDWKNNGVHDTGVIAQEVEAQFPNLVMTDKAGFKAVKYANMAGIFIESTKELNSKITKLEAENKMLKSYLCEKDPYAPFCH